MAKKMNDDNERGINLGIEYSVNITLLSGPPLFVPLINGVTSLSLSLFLRDKQMMQRERKQRALYA